MGESSCTRATRRDVDRFVEVLSSIRQELPICSGGRRNRASEPRTLPSRTWTVVASLVGAAARSLVATPGSLGR